MTFLADENFPRPAVEALRQAGLDVHWIAERIQERLTMKCWRFVCRRAVSY